MDRIDKIFYSGATIFIFTIGLLIFNRCKKEEKFRRKCSIRNGEIIKLRHDLICINRDVFNKTIIKIEEIK